MKIEEYIKSLDSIKINDSAVKDVEERYKIKCPEILKKIISNAKEPVFLDDEIRILSLLEILNASRDLHVQFIKLGMIPFADCYDNDFIVYCRDGKWAYFNITDEIKYDEVQEFYDLFKKESLNE